MQWVNRECHQTGTRENQNNTRCNGIKIQGDGKQLGRPALTIQECREHNHKISSRKGWDYSMEKIQGKEIQKRNHRVWGMCMVPQVKLGRKGQATHQMGNGNIPGSQGGIR